jgi:hypothetical protein
VAHARSWLPATYGAALWLCPPGFRRRFGDELARDFADGLADVRRTGFRGDVAAYVGHSAIDLLKTYVLQWARTGGVLQTLVSTVGLALVIVVTALLQGVHRWPVRVAPEDEPLVTLLLILGGLFLVIVATIFLTQYLLWPGRGSYPPAPVGRPGPSRRA